jgi:Dyp-type peroxidase family
LKVADGDKGRRWVGRLATTLNTAAHHPKATAVNIAFTASGLRALGLGEDALATFSLEFQEGMRGPDGEALGHRSRILGDTEKSAPSTWVFGGPNQPEIHAMLLLYGATEDDLAQLCRAQQAEYQGTGAMTEVFVRDTTTLPERMEHFGFADGLAQPRVMGSGAQAKPGAPLIEAGEFVLGYPNEYDKLPPSPSVASALDPEANLIFLDGGDRRDLGRNGTYLVVRQLAQDVEGFWRTMYEKSRGASGEPDREEAIRLASKCVGRWPSGAPLVRTPGRDDPMFREDNGFGYFREDPQGLKCPVGAHIRRANPRDSLEPGPDASLGVVNRHRILRRGRSYGPRLPPFERETVGVERGLFFICVNTNIRRQFEFIQQTWLNNPKFNGLYVDKDPLVGDHDPTDGGTFTVPKAPERRQLTGLPRFVTTRGGQYFFLPSIRAMRALGKLKPGSASQ